MNSLNQSQFGFKEVGATENEIQKSIENSKKPTQLRRIPKKIITGMMLVLCTFLLAYFGLAYYFINHFYFGSEINTVDVSGKTVEAAKRLLASQLQEYTLDLKERGGKIEQIKGSEIGLAYRSEEDFKNLKDSQNPYGWVLFAFHTEESKMTIDVSYDEKLMKERLERLSCFDASQVIEPKNPSFRYSGTSYEIVDETLGNKVNKEVLSSQVTDAILKGETVIDLESAGAYVKPLYTSNSKKIKEIRDLLNLYVSTKIIYTFGNANEILDCSTINNWLTVDEDFVIRLDENKIKDYIVDLSKTYDTIGTERSFETSSGTTIHIGGGDYGRFINVSKETQALISAIKDGKTITKEPVYNQKAFSLIEGINDLGNTYVEIDLSKQHIWFYKNGLLIVEGNTVTGNVSTGYSTPAGIYRIKYKQMNTILRGADYAVPVTYWMPFNGGIGLHDANWRSEFGGTIYQTNGSHGCINLPYNVAQMIFNNIDVDAPVILY